MRTLLTALGILTLATATLAAPTDDPPKVEQNWHQWRGPAATGVAPTANPPLEWDETKNVKWKVKIPGESTATPIVWGNQIFLATAVMTDRTIELPEGEDTKKGPFRIEKPKNYYEFVVMSIDRRTGQILWQHKAKEDVPHEGRHPDASYASASPMTDGKNLYVSFGSRGVYCYDLTGKPKWSRDLGKMKIFNRFGEGSSPVVHGDSVVVNWDHQDGSFITALDSNTGETRWKVDRDETSTWATPLMVELGGRTQVVVHGSKRVRSYDLANGELIWACGGQTPSAIPCPVTDGENVYLLSGYLGNAVYAIPLTTEGDITEFAKKTEPEKIPWKRISKGAPYVPSPLLYEGLLYYLGGNKGILTCLEAKTGEPKYETTRLQGIENIYASPVAAAGHIFITSREGNTIVIKPGGAEPEIVATNKLDERFDASLAVVGDEILLRGKEYLYCISAGN